MSASNKIWVAWSPIGRVSQGPMVISEDVFSAEEIQEMHDHGYRFDGPYVLLEAVVDSLQDEWSPGPWTGNHRVITEAVRFVKEKFEGSANIREGG